MMRRCLLICALIVVASRGALGASSSIVISQVYAGQLGQSDFVELFNRGSVAISMDGWTLQVSPASDDGQWAKVPLSGMIAAGQYYMIRVAEHGGRGLSPAPDTSKLGLQFEGSGGQIAVVETDSLLLSNCSLSTSVSGVIDFMSWGTSRCGSHAPAWNSETAVVRLGGGCKDTDGGEDFTTATPVPRTSGSLRNLCGSSSNSATRTFSIATGSGSTFATTGTGNALTGGYAQVNVDPTSERPTGLAVFGLRQGGTLISEASVPAMTPLRSGLFYVETSGSINTGVAIANQNNEDIDVNFQLVEPGGALKLFGTLSVPANTQIARFMNELPFGLSTPTQGTLSFSTSLPVSVIVLRGYTNQRGEFLVTTLPVTDATAPVSNSPSYLAYFAVNGGWKTDVILTCPGPTQCNGAIEFRDQAGSPVTIRTGSFSGTSLPYSLPQLSSDKYVITGIGDPIVSGSVRIAPSDGTVTPVGTAVFSYTRNNVTVSEAGLISPRGSRFRTYVEFSGQVGAVGSIQPGLAITNTESATTTVALELVRLDGTSTGLSTSLTIPANGQVAKFLNELFPTLAAPFQGVLKLNSPGLIAMAGLRGRYNERRDFLITTVPAIDENAPVASGQLVFPHIVDSGGYTTQFILFGATGQASSGTLRLFSTGGQPLTLQFQ